MRVRSGSRGGGLRLFGRAPEFFVVRSQPLETLSAIALRLSIGCEDVTDVDVAIGGAIVAVEMALLAHEFAPLKTSNPSTSVSANAPPLRFSMQIVRAPD